MEDKYKTNKRFTEMGNPKALAKPSPIFLVLFVRPLFPQGPATSFYNIEKERHLRSVGPVTENCFLPR